MNISSVKAIVCDMDGTLLTARGTIHPLDIQSIHTLHERGIHFFIATGRHLNFVLPYIKLIGSQYIDAVITLSGAAIYAGSDLTLLHKTPMLPALSSDFISYLNETGSNGCIYSEFIPFFKRAPKKGDALPSEFFADQTLLYTYQKDYLHLEDYSPFIGGDILKCTITRQPESFFNRFRTRFSTLSKCIYHNSDQTFSCEAMDSSVTKTSGIAIAATYFQLDFSDLLVIGDSNNDLDMLESAKYAATPRDSKILADGTLTLVDHSFAMYHSHPVLITNDHNSGILQNILSQIV